MRDYAGDSCLLFERAAGYDGFQLRLFRPEADFGSVFSLAV